MSEDYNEKLKDNSLENFLKDTLVDEQKNETKPLGKEPEKASDFIETLEAVYDVPVQVSAVLGKTSMPISQLLKLGRGAVLELDKRVGEAIDIYVNNRLIARGEIIVVDDHLGITMTEIIKTKSA